MADSGGEKKHDATDYRRQKAREEGNVVRSPDLTSAVLLLAGVMLLNFTGPQVFRMLIDLINEELTRLLDWKSDSRTAVLQVIRLIGKGSLALIPLMGGVLCTSLLVHFAQVGPLWLPDKLGIDFTRINPVQGFQRLFTIINASKLGAKIRKIALEHGIPIVERKPLAQALFKQVEIGQAIPLSESAAVAEVLKYVYQVQGRSISVLTKALK